MEQIRQPDTNSVGEKEAGGGILEQIPKEVIDRYNLSIDHTGPIDTLEIRKDNGHYLAIPIKDIQNIQHHEDTAIDIETPMQCSTLWMDTDSIHTTIFPKELIE